MPKLFANSDSESDDVGLKTDNNYASTYNTWRQKEELNKLKTKYGEEVLNLDDESSASSSSDSDDDGEERIPEELEKEFFKTLSSLKNKDPKIYDENFEFFKNPIDRPSKSPKKKDTALYVKDYERKMLLENDVDELEDVTAPQPQTTYVEEQNQLKQNLKDALETIDGDGDGDWGGLFKARQKTKLEQKKEDDEYREWLTGHKDKINDINAESDLKPLRDYWSDPNLGESDKFLRDYILNKRFLDKEDENYVPTYQEIIHDSDDGLSEDEEVIEKQEEFEYKYNYRFEEPDQEFIKRYPRSMENSVRKQDDRRKIKRAETKERKLEVKRHKMEEIKQMQDLKRKEIDEKIMKLKEITGNTDVQFNSEDIEDDFDPDAHDRRMRALFDDEFYEGVEGEQKPEFPELDDELEIENWDKLETEENQVHCEDEGFNMDCDYNPEQELKSQDKTKERRKRKRKSKFAEAVSEVKPIFNPQDKTYQEYLDEYYKLDCEDIIGDVPCRFKYRQVVSNDFGLSTEEILLAKDKELNRWCSIKKAIQYRPQNVEKYDVVAFSKKAQNEALKRKVLPSLFVSEEPSTVKEKEDKTVSTQNNKKRKKLEDLIPEESAASTTNKKKKDASDTSDENMLSTIRNEETSQNVSEINNKLGKKKKKRKHRNIADKVKDETKRILPPLVAEELEENKHFENQNKKKQRKRESSSFCNGDADADPNWNVTSALTFNGEGESTSELNGNKTKKKCNKIVGPNKDTNSNVNEKRKRMQQRRKGNEKNNPVKISDARLTAYGFKPKKFKNKMKYGQNRAGI